MSERKAKLMLAAIVLWLSVVAWSNRFVQDDAFISFRYAQNLVHGHGLVFNPGERVEGYTNFLWTVLVAGGLALGIDPVAFTFVVGIICFALSLILTYKLSRLLLRSTETALLTTILLGTNYTFSCYATGGLETQLQAALLTCCAWLALRWEKDGRYSGKSLAALSLVSALAVLTRPDSLLPVAVFCGYALAQAASARKERQEWLKNVVFLAGPLFLVIGPWLLWKVAFYGELLPNTFYAKVHGVGLIEGLRYLCLFALSYFLVPFLVLFALSLKNIFRSEGRRLCVVAFVVIAWCVYVACVGGDFMEFRFLVPVMPLMFVVVGWLCFVFPMRREVQLALAIVVLLGSVHHALTFGKALDTHGVETIADLEGHLFREDENWVGVGKALGKYFGGSAVVLACKPCGAIPFYSGLPTIDMLGLSDRWIARHGWVPQEQRAGHRREATLGYLVARKANLVVGHPEVLSTAAPHKPFYTVTDINATWVHVDDPNLLPHEAKIVAIPIGRGHELLALYLVRHEKIEETIRRRRWRTYPIYFCKPAARPHVKA